MKRNLLIFCFFISFFAGGQEPQKSYELKETITGTKEYVARDYIILGDGFSYTASGDDSFTAKIDQCLLFPPTDGTYGTPDGVAGPTPSSGGVVGSIPGKFDVNPTGAATYSIPIEVPDGVNGLKPDLSFTFNSQLQNGICGLGSAISGMSSISLSSKNPYFDGDYHPVSFDGDDRFSLDGKPLMVSEGDNYGDDGSTYHTESESFARITSKGKVQSVPSWFKIETKEGITMEFGNSSSSKIELPGKNQPYAWRINRIIDQNKNYIDFEYEERNGESWVSSVKYGGNLVLNKPHIYEVSFEYKSREDDSFVVLAGVKLPQTKILTNVFVKKGSTVLREYTFNYSTNVHSRIQSISLSGMDGEKMNSTEFKWERKENTLENSISIDCHSAFPADFNNDGLDDLYIIEEENDKYYERLYYSNGESLVKQSWQNVIGSDGSLQDGVFDYNGDGLLDLFYWQGHSDNRKGGVLKRNTGNGFTSILVDLPYGGATPKFAFGDFNGDGYGQIFAFYRDGSCKFVNFNGQAIEIKSVDNNDLLTLSVFDDIERLHTGDFNGDGKLDLGYVNSGYFHALSIDNNNQVQEIFVLEIPDGDYDKYFSLGDFNGDGITDFCYKGSLYFWKEGGKYSYYNNLPYPRDSYSDFFEENPMWDKEQLDLQCKESTLIKDTRCLPVNSDNKTDLLYSYQKDYWFNREDGRPFTQEQIAFIDIFSGGRAEYYSDIDGKRHASWKSDIFFGVGFSIGNGKLNFAKEQGTWYWQSQATQDRYFVLDLNGDGISKVYRRFATNSPGEFRFYSTGYPGDLNTRFVKEINKGIGEKIKLNYSNLSEPDDVYALGSGANFPVKDVTPSLFVVSDVISSNGSLSDEISKYYYSGAKAHAKGKGFLGFISTKRKNLSTGMVRESNKILNTNYYTLVPQSSQVRDGSSDKISQTTQDITLVSQGNKRYWARTNSVTKTDNLKNTSVKQTFNDYDSYGNPKNIKTEYLNGGSNSGISETKEIIYTNTGPTTNIKPKKITLTKTNENGSQTRINRFAYDEKGNLTRKTRDVGDDNELVKTYTDYDAFGNPGTVTESANGKSRSTSFEYSATGRFLEKETDDFTDFSTTYNYNETTALLTSETDHLGRTTEYEYDGFGRLVKTTHPDGTYSVKTRQWAGGDGPDDAIYFTYKETSGESPVWTWYDGLGRELRTEYYGFDTDKKIRVDKKYNPKGRVESVSKPYFANGDREWAESYIYDNYGRTDTKTTPMGTTTMSYDGLTTTITTPRSVKVKTENAAGQTVSNKVDGRTVTFSYYPSGKVKTATPQGGKSVEMFYDTQGNRIKITDPDAGVVETTYNGFGELTSEEYTMGSGEDERTVTTSYTYDGAGRLIETDQNGKITDYKHNDSNGFLESISNSDHKVTYTYDEGSNKHLGRPTTVKEQIEGKAFIFKTSYDAFGREQKHTYPSGFYVKNSYTKYGHLQQVKGSNGKSIWKGEEANALNQFVKTKKGGKISTFGYDDKDRPENIYSPGIIDHFYKFNDKGNLESREDRLTSQEEIFTYEKHQLKTWKIKQNGSVASTFSMDYDEHGNITGKSDIGYEMQYNDKRPHAISGIDGNPSLISDEEQTITYTDFKKIETVKEGSNSLDLTYGIDDQRRKGTFKTNDETTLTRYYLGDYEEEQTPDGQTRKIHYLSGGNGLAAIYVETDGNGQLYYAYTDYLGSLTALTDADGEVVERQAFDPWGNRRNPNDWTSLITTPVSHITGRGYTMHEHLDGFALINMNGRVYDPQIARFLSPDPQLQAPGYWLNYNRYGYALNNPLIYTDPSGEIAWFVPVAIGAVVGAEAGGWISSGTPAFWKWQSDDWKAAGVGAMLGATAGSFVSSAVGATGMTVGNAGNVATKSWGIASTALQNASINIGFSAVQGLDVDGMWKAGITGLASGAWTATGGLGLVKEGFLGRLAYQNVGLAGSSIGRNWAGGEDLFSKVSVGLGPVNLTLGENQSLLQWQNNIGNIAFNAIGLSNRFLGSGEMSFDWGHLTPSYYGGVMEKFSKGAMGAHVIMGSKMDVKGLHLHELHHIWQSRSLGDVFLPAYVMQGLNASLFDKSFSDFIFDLNYFETQAYGGYWW